MDPTEAGTPVPPAGQPFVLIVDDDVDAAELLRDALEAAGYGAATAHDGAEGLALARIHRPDLILLDLMMPDISGWAFLDLYRHVPGPHAPVIVVSAIHPASLDMSRLTGAGADDVIRKPFSLDHLLAVVRQHLRARVA